MSIKNNLKKLNPKRLTTAQKRQAAVATLAISAILGVAGITVKFVENKRSKNAETKVVEEKKSIVATDFTAPNHLVSNEALWKETGDARLDELESRINAMLKDGQTGSSQSSLAMAQTGNGPDGLGNPNLYDPNTITGLNGSGQLPPLPPTTSLPSPGSSIPSTVGSIKSLDNVVPMVSDPNQPPGTANNGSVRNAPNYKNSNEWVQVKRHVPNIEITENGGQVTRGKFRARDSFIPTGTFFRSVLLGGVDAPTGGDAQNANPHPLLLRVIDFAQLPNHFKYNFKECFITASAYGDISAERAYIRPERLSCVGTDGRAIDMKIKGYVAGEDGKTGVRGTVVTKQGQILANALFAGIIGGLGKGLSESYKVTNDTAFGSSTSVNGGDRYKAGVADGVNSAADRLAQYYIKLADKVFPVVEINAGREVDVVLMEGIQIETDDE